MGEDAWAGDTVTLGEGGVLVRLGGEREFNFNKIAMPHVGVIGERCTECGTRLDNATRGQTCPRQ